MRVEQVAHLLGGRVGKRRRFALELAQLTKRDADGGGEALALGRNLVGADAVFGDRDLAIVADERRADADAAGNAESMEDALALRLVATRRRTVTPHRSRR